MDTFVRAIAAAEEVVAAAEAGHGVMPAEVATAELGHGVTTAEVATREAGHGVETAEVRRPISDTYPL